MAIDAARHGRNINDIRTVAVLGSGTMGSGIAHVFARCGYSVILRDVEKRYLDRAIDSIGKNLDRERLADDLQDCLAAQA